MVDSITQAHDGSDLQGSKNHTSSKRSLDRNSSPNSMTITSTTTTAAVATTTAAATNDIMNDSSRTDADQLG